MAMTISQEKAVNSEGNVLVSAGAGSGKTTVLTNRVIKKINEGVKLDEFLILTFTVAASHEMRERIKMNLLKNNRYDLISMVDAAHIETFDAYALYVLKKYGYVLGLTKAINNVPTDVICIQKQKYIDEIFNNYYHSRNQDFVDLIHTYCFKNDEYIKKFILDFYDIYDSKLDKEAYLDNYANEYLDESMFEDAPSELIKFVKEDLEDIRVLINQFSKEKYINIYSTSCDNIINANNLVELSDALRSFTKPRVIMTNDHGDQSIRETLYKYIESLQKKYDSYNEDIYYNEDVKNARKFIPFIINIIRELDKKLYRFQCEKGFFTFKEIANLAYKILNEHEDIANEMKSKIKLIFIDEYQDTSDLQDKFISLISNNNVFVVGDVKQSIYLFRGANPKNFVKKYSDYSKTNQAIDMNENFRSRKEVVDKINDIFCKIMTINYGGADYSVSHILKAKNTSYEDIGKIEGQHGIVTMSIEKNKVGRIIDDIKKRIANHQKIFDRDEGVVREVEYRDFAILSPKKINFPNYEDEFRNANIPITAVYNEQLLSDMSITVLLSLLKSVSLFNKDSLTPNEVIRLKHYYISIKRSFLFSENDQDIYKEVSDNSYINGELYLKLKSFANEHQNELISELFMALLNDFNFISKLSLLDNPFAEIDKIKLFYDRIIVMDNLNYTLDDFIFYLEDLNNMELEIDSDHEEKSDNSVKLTTIHKAKGLQYKVVYLVDLSLGSSKDNGKGKGFYTEENGGCWLPGFAFSNCLSIQARLSDYYSNNRFNEETMRRLYVALTRAEDTCVLCIDKDDLPPNQIEKCKTLLDFIEFSEVPFDKDYYEQIELENKKNEVKPIKAEKPIEFLLNNVSFDKDFIKNTASKDLRLDTDLTILNYGTHMHLLMQQVDFVTKDLDFIKDPIEKSRIKRVLDNKIFKDVINAKVYKEYQFIDEKNDSKGTIDLLLIYKNKVVIVDYKLKNIDDIAYEKQLKVYKDFIEEKHKGPVACYLLSLIDDEVKEVK